MDDQTKTTAPQNACIFEQGCSVAFDKAEGDDGDSRFSIVAYSGQIITGHWWWGNVAFDLEGIKFAKARTPVLQEHFRTDRIGFSTKQDVSDKVTLEGKFLSNSLAQELRNDMAEGFPMQASVFLPPDIIEQVKEGETVEVNGHKLKGPGAVFRKGKIHEVSMCTLGADSHTQSKAFAEGGKQEVKFNLFRKDSDMAENINTKLTAETFAAEHPDIFEQVTAKAKAEGEKAQVERFKEIAEVCGDDYELAAGLFVDGRDKNEALSAKNKKLTEQLAASQKQTAANETVDPAEAEFSDEQKPESQGKDKDGEGPPDFNAAVEARIIEAKCAKGEAMKFAVEKYPALYKKYLDEIEKKAQQNQRD